mgnify:CR=1 FL=1
MKCLPFFHKWPKKWEIVTTRRYKDGFFGDYIGDTVVVLQCKICSEWNKVKMRKVEQKME